MNGYSYIDEAYNNVTENLKNTAQITNENQHVIATQRPQTNTQNHIHFYKSSYAKN